MHKLSMNTEVKNVVDMGSNFAVAVDILGTETVLPVKKQDGLEIKPEDGVIFVAEIDPNPESPSIRIVKEEGVKFLRDQQVYAKAELKL